MNAGFWRGRRVLVTGHTGFKGGWLVLWLHRLGARVTGLALAPQGASNLFDAASIREACASHLVDVRDADAVSRLVAAAAPEVVFHLAAQPLVRASYADAAATWDVNVMGAIHVLDACRRCAAVRAVVVVTSDKCYEHERRGARDGSSAFVEGDALGGHDPYSSSKAAVELAVASWRRSFFAEGRAGLATARAGNVVGGGDWAPDRLLPDLARGARAGDSIAIRSPRATRPWQHVLDPLAGYLELAERLHRAPTDYDEAWNFGPDASDAWSVSRVADAFARRLDRGVRWHVAEDASLHEAHALALDSAKARTRLGWSPRLSTDDALAFAADAYRAELDGESLHATIERQMDAYATRVDPARAAA